MMRSLILFATALVVANGVWREEDDEHNALAPVGADTVAAASLGGADIMMKSSGGPSLMYDDEEPRFNKSLCKVRVGEMECKQDKVHKANCFWSANKNECRKRMWGETCKRADTMEECAKNDKWLDRCYWNITRNKCLKTRESDAVPTPPSDVQHSDETHHRASDLDGQSCDSVWTDCNGCDSTGDYCGTPNSPTRPVVCGFERCAERSVDDAENDCVEWCGTADSSTSCISLCDAACSEDSSDSNCYDCAAQNDCMECFSCKNSQDDHYNTVDDSYNTVDDSYNTGGDSYDAMPTATPQP